MIRFETRLAPKEGLLLVASVLIQDSIFTRKVVLLVEHKNDDGSLGLILNYRMEALLEREDIKSRRRFPLYHGGPVGPDTLHCLHKGTQRHLRKGKRLLKNVYWGGHTEDAQTLMQEYKEDRIRFFVGYAGWSGGQLEKEVRGLQWYVLEGSGDFIFRTPPKEMWSSALQKLGPHYMLLRNYPPDLSLH